LLLATCHARASDWYAENDLVRESVEHALAIPDDERAAAMLEQSGWWMIQTMESRQISAWANRIAEPVLSRSLDRLPDPPPAGIPPRAEVLTGNASNRRWLDGAEELVAGDDGTRQAYSNLLAWVRSGSLARERRYTEAALALSTIVDRPDPSGMVLQRILPPL